MTTTHTDKRPTDATRKAALSAGRTPTVTKGDDTFVPAAPATLVHT